MQRYLMAVTFALVATAPALAQSQFAPLPYAPPSQARQMLVLDSPPQSPVVAADGRVIGQDPDPDVRLEMRRSAQLESDGITATPQ